MTVCPAAIDEGVESVTVPGAVPCAPPHTYVMLFWSPDTEVQEAHEAVVVPVMVTLPAVANVATNRPAAAMASR